MKGHSSGHDVSNSSTVYACSIISGDALLLLPLTHNWVWHPPEWLQAYREASKNYIAIVNSTFAIRLASYGDSKETTMGKKLLTLLCIATLSFVMNACRSPQVPSSSQPTATPTGNGYTYPPLNTKIYTDTSPVFLQGNAMGGLIAQTPPTIDFGSAVIDAQKYSTDYGDWGNAVLGPDGKYYFGLGDHSSSTGGFNGALLMDYDPVKKQPEILLFSKDILGAGGEGKWHCRMDINPANGDMYFIGFYNGNLIYYNI